MTDEAISRGTRPEKGLARDFPAQEHGAYQVLARKYRPASFKDLIGQEALVRTLTNAMEGNRLHHAFILTGVRGVGKTTSARIIAKALNCVGPDGTGGPTPDPCGVCESCVSIAQDRHIDVMEMDAASRTGVDDVRELIESVRYRPVSARKKVYIIDEIHMLSKSAFNALLKTLEEPPEHVIFIFATTEIRKLPVTVLSRCQRFDLRRVEHRELAEHFERILQKETVAFDAESLALLARAADGSVRDGLSLLDQAIALGGGRAIEAEAVRNMLGMADRTRIFDLMEASLSGDCASSLAILDGLYKGGAEPSVVVGDLLELSHLLTRIKLVPDTLQQTALPQAERDRGGDFARRLSMPILARTWQILLKGLEEVQRAPKPLQAAEMLLVRLAHSSTLPTPGELVKKLKGALATETPANNACKSTGAKNAPTIAAISCGKGLASVVQDHAVAPQPAQDLSRRATVVGGPNLTAADNAASKVQRQGMMQRQENGYYPLPERFSDVIAMARQEDERVFAACLSNDLHLVRFESGYLSFQPGKNAPRDMGPRLKRLLQDWTGIAWGVEESKEQGVATLRQQEKQINEDLDRKAMQDPMVQTVLSVFPHAKMVKREGLEARCFVVDGLEEVRELEVLELEVRGAEDGY